MPWIQNCAASDINTGLWHRLPDDNTILIQITDPASWVPASPFSFKKTYHFEFLDIEKDDYVFDEECRCSQAQADELVKILKDALTNGDSVLVHCHAGICRSGAVTEIGVMLGFEDTGRYRQPNLLVKHQMMKALGWAYDPDEEAVPFNLSAKFDWEGDI